MQSTQLISWVSVLEAQFLALQLRIGAMATAIEAMATSTDIVISDNKTLKNKLAVSQRQNVLAGQRHDRAMDRVLALIETLSRQVDDQLAESRTRTRALSVAPEHMQSPPYFTMEGTCEIYDNSVGRLPRATRYRATPY